MVMVTFRKVQLTVSIHQVLLVTSFKTIWLDLVMTVRESGHSTERTAEYRDVFLWSFEEHWVWRWFSIHDPPVFLAGKEKMFVWCKSVCNTLYVTFIFGRVCSVTPDIVGGSRDSSVCSGYYRDKFMDTFGLSFSGCILSYYLTFQKS